jgi:predicted transcriptional regulator
VNSRNLTLKLDSDLYKAVKLVAAQRDSSISALVAEKLKELVEEETGYSQARAHALEHLDEGFDLGTHGSISWSRDELHER